MRRKGREVRYVEGLVTREVREVRREEPRVARLEAFSIMALRGGDVSWVVMAGCDVGGEGRGGRNG